MGGNDTPFIYPVRGQRRVKGGLREQSKGKTDRDRTPDRYTERKTERRVGQKRR